MKIFIDTANIDEIKDINRWGILDGVTTNPTLIAREQGRDFKEIIKEIASLVPGPISAEVISTDAEGMVREGEELAAIAENVVIKIPMVEEGLIAVNQLNKKGIKTNVTLVFSPNQALLAARAGATFVSPFVGRLDDIGHNGMELVQDVVKILEWYQLDTEVIAASIRHPRHVYQAAAAGAHIATVPYGVLKKMVNHPMTDKGLEKFIQDWKLIKK